MKTVDNATPTMLQVLAQKGKLTFEECDIVENQYTNFLDMKVASERSAFAEYNPYIAEDRIDKFFHQRLANVGEYKNLWAMVKVVLLLSHGQAQLKEVSLWTNMYRLLFNLALPSFSFKYYSLQLNILFGTGCC